MGTTEQRDRLAQTICDERWGEDGEVHQPTDWDLRTADAVLAALGLVREYAVEHQDPITYSALVRPPDEEMRRAAKSLRKRLVTRLATEWVTDQPAAATRGADHD